MQSIGLVMCLKNIVTRGYTDFKEVFYALGVIHLRETKIGFSGF